MAGVERFWLHAPFAELAPCAIDPLVRQVTEKRYRQAADMAQDLGVRRLVIHGGFVPQVYFPEWYVEQSVLFWRDFLRQLPPDMTVALENVMEPQPRLLADIARQVDDPRLGLCLDIGHANTFVSRAPPLEWVAPMAPWLRHVHLHNNAGHDDAGGQLGKGGVEPEALHSGHVPPDGGQHRRVLQIGSIAERRNLQPQPVFPGQVRRPAVDAGQIQTVPQGFPSHMRIPLLY